MFLYYEYDRIDLLDGLYIDSRYPGDIGLLPEGKSTLDEAKEFYDFAQKIFNEVCSILNINPEEIKKQYRWYLSSVYPKHKFHEHLTTFSTPLITLYSNL